MALKFREIKHPLFYAIKGDAMTIWWIDNEEDVCYFEHIPENYPAFTLGSFDSIEDARDMASQMKGEGWEVIDNEVKDLEEKKKMRYYIDTEGLSEYIEADSYDDAEEKVLNNISILSQEDREE